MKNNPIFFTPYPFVLIFLFGIGFVARCHDPIFKEMEMGGDILQPTENFSWKYSDPLIFSWSSIEGSHEYRLLFNQVKIYEGTSLNYRWDQPDCLYHQARIQIKGENHFQFYYGKPLNISRWFPDLNSWQVQIDECNNNNLQMSWDQISDADGYLISAFDVSGNKILDKDLPAVTSTQINIPQSGNYRVGLQFHWRGQTCLSSSAAQKQIYVRPTTPIDFKIEGSSCSGDKTLKWTAENNETYEFQVGTAPNLNDIISGMTLGSTGVYDFKINATGSFYARIRRAGQNCPNSWSLSPLFFVTSTEIVPPSVNMQCTSAYLPYNLSTLPEAGFTIQNLLDEFIGAELRDGGGSETSILNLQAWAENPSECFKDSTSIFAGFVIADVNGSQSFLQTIYDPEKHLWKLSTGDATYKKAQLLIPKFGTSDIYLIAYKWDGQKYFPATRSKKITVTYVGPDQGSVQIQLSWDDISDLDLNLIGPGGAFSVSRGNLDCSGCPVPAGCTMKLDLDNQIGFGPENITINGPCPAGLYKVFTNVYNFDALNPPLRGQISLIRNGVKAYEMCDDTLNGSLYHTCDCFIGGKSVLVYEFNYP